MQGYRIPSFPQLFTHVTPRWTSLQRYALSEAFFLFLFRFLPFRYLIPLGFKFFLSIFSILLILSFSLLFSFFFFFFSFFLFFSFSLVGVISQRVFVLLLLLLLLLLQLRYESRTPFFRLNEEKKRKKKKRKEKKEKEKEEEKMRGRDKHNTNNRCTGALSNLIAEYLFACSLISIRMTGNPPLLSSRYPSPPPPRLPLLHLFFPSS